MAKKRVLLLSNPPTQTFIFMELVPIYHKPGLIGFNVHAWDEATQKLAELGVNQATIDVAKAGVEKNGVAVVDIP